MQDSIQKSMDNEILKKKEGYEKQIEYINDQINDFQTSILELNNATQENLKERKTLQDEIKKNESTIKKSQSDLKDAENYATALKESSNN